MKIALCKSYFAGPVSGADETLVTYAVALREAGEDVRVVLMYRHTNDDPYYERLRKADVPVSCVITHSLAFSILRSLRTFLSSLLFFLFLGPRSPERLRRIWQVMLNLVSRFHYGECRAYFAAVRPDLLHVFTPDSGAALMIRAGHELGLPVLYQELGTPHYLPALDVYYRRLEKVLPLCTEVSALSPRLAAQWSERFPFLNSVTVMPLMVADGDGHAVTARRAATCETVFGYAARFEEGKGPLVLIEALTKLNRERHLGIVRMAGMGPQLLEVKAMTRELGLGDACEFVSHYTEPLGRSAFMSSLDVFILPSLAEGTPNGVIEAMAHGLPVIASEVGGIPDLVSEDSGILVPPGNDEDLAAAMRRLANDPEQRAKMGAAARERYLKLFSPDAVLPVLQSTYHRVASKQASQFTAMRTTGVAHPWEVIAEF
ncbi:MAG TPA: glycosyltransferase family 4 protein [Pyrinomonadaceae bacterium]|nr:glycosyltransferase family 4 protein [Pyrinomonadaceae bacterium]